MTEEDEDLIFQMVALLESLGANVSLPSSYNYHEDESLFSLLLQQHRRTLEQETPAYKAHFASLQEEEAFYTTNILGAMACVAFVALIAGLFLGYLTLDSLDLKIIERASIDDDERIYATTILPIVKERHRVLVTLLILNGLAYETLPLFLDNLVPSWVAILLSVTLIMLFGEIIPSGIFTGPRQLYLGYKMAPLMQAFLWLCWPFATPLAMLLDYLVSNGDGGDEEEGYHRGEISALVRIQHELDVRRHSGATKGLVARKTKLWRLAEAHSSAPNWAEVKNELMGRIRERESKSSFDEYFEEESVAASVAQMMPPLHRTEVDVIEGALRMKTSLAMDIYTPYSKVYAIPENLILDKKNMTMVYAQGFSRVPVYRPNPKDPEDISNILGFLITRQLMLVDWDHKREVSTLSLQRPQCVSPRMNLVDLLRLLQSGAHIMTFVCVRPDLANKALDREEPIPIEAGFIGIITLEDIMESILQDRIYDEGDTKDRDRAVSTLTRWAATKLQDFYRRKAAKRRGSITKNESPERLLANEKTPLIPSSGVCSNERM